MNAMKCDEIFAVLLNHLLERHTRDTFALTLTGWDEEMGFATKTNDSTIRLLFNSFSFLPKLRDTTV